MSTPATPTTGGVGRFPSISNSLAARDIGLLMVRAGLTWIFIYHGAETLFGSFHGAGLHASAEFDANVAHLRPGLLFAVLGGSVEFFGGIAIALGLLSRLAALGLLVDMVMAMITVTFKNGVSTSTATVHVGGGYELNVALAALAAALLLLGAGRWSLDAVIGSRLRTRLSRRRHGSSI